jgi:hypothetical protein
MKDDPLKLEAEGGRGGDRRIKIRGRLVFY